MEQIEECYGSLMMHDSIYEFTKYRAEYAPHVQACTILNVEPVSLRREDYRHKRCNGKGGAAGAVKGA